MMKGKGIDRHSSSMEDEEINISTQSWLGQVKRNSALRDKKSLGQVKRNSALRDKKSHDSKPVCIYRVPQPMRICKPEVYDPFVVSFGPFHHKMNPQLSTMDKHKLEALHVTSGRLDMDVPKLIACIKDLDGDIRECYEDPIEWDAETLSWAFAMDACFILEFLKVFTRTARQNDMDRFSLAFQSFDHKNPTSYAILYDIMKMENQIPLIILKSLLEMEFETKEWVEEMLCKMLLLTELFEGFPFCLPSAGKKEPREKIEELKKHVVKEPAHLLDLYRMVIKDLLTHSTTESASHAVPENGDASHAEPGNTDASHAEPQSGNTNSHHRCGEWLINMAVTPQRSSSYDRCIPTAELLKKAGIRFEQGKIGFRQRRFAKSTLSLPHIRVNGSTETLLRNVMAYEECQRCLLHPKETVISKHLVLVDYLIDSAIDVSILRKARVISGLACSDEDMACIFNNITEGITVRRDEEFEKLMEEAREHYDSQWNVWISQFQKEYCSKPWYVVSLAVGILFLTLTAVQTVYTVKN